MTLLPIPWMVLQLTLMAEVLKLTRLVDPTNVGVHTRIHTTPTRSTPPSSFTQTPLCLWKKSWSLPPKKMSQQRWEEGLAFKKENKNKKPSLLPTAHTPVGYVLVSLIRCPEAVRTRTDIAPFGLLPVTTLQPKINFRVGRGRKKKAERKDALAPLPLDLHVPVFPSGK